MDPLKTYVSLVEPGLWDKACEELRSADHALGSLMDAYASERLSGSGEPFRTLANAIVGQQISVKAASSIWARLEAGLGDMSPSRALAARDENLRAWGLSGRKVEYFKGLAEAFIQERIQPSTWHGLSDEEIIASLTSLRGIGRWTAEMFLIFHLHRPDVLPLDDIAFIRAAWLHYGWAGEDGIFPGARAMAQKVAAYAEGWRPWRTVAVWYLWRSLDPEPVVY